MFEIFKNPTSSSFLNITDSEKWIPVLWKNQNQNQRIVGSGYFRQLKELAMLYKRTGGFLSPVVIFMPQKFWEPGLCTKTEDMICENHDYKLKEPAW